MSALHCFFCGGKECKYENWKLWTGEKYQGVNAVDGLFSNWITNKILAMQRPSTRLIKEYNLISAFKEKKIGAIFNLQSFGEHVSCGDGIEQTSGFSYLPETFIENNIKYYNFGWADMDTPDINLMLTMVNVMAFALEDDHEKVAVHCHAGLGRTGLTIACYLIYSENIPAEAAILIVRGKRPLSVQTKKQSMFVISFEKYLKKLRIVFPLAVEKSLTVILNIEPMTFTEFIDNQRKLLRNSDLRYLRYIPKLVHIIINQLLVLCAKDELQWYNSLDSFVLFQGIDRKNEKIRVYQNEMNQSEWGGIRNESDPKILVEILLDWFITLKEPLLNQEKVKALSFPDLSWNEKCEKIGKEEFETINLILKFLRQIPSISKTTLDTALEVLATVFTSDRTSLKYFVDFNPPKPFTTQANDTYGARMFDTFKSFRSTLTPVVPAVLAAPVVSAESGQTHATKGQTESSFTSVTSLTVFQKSAEVLSHMAATGKQTLFPINFGKELPRLPAENIESKQNPAHTSNLPLINIGLSKPPSETSLPPLSKQQFAINLKTKSELNKIEEDAKRKVLERLPSIPLKIDQLKSTMSEEMLNKNESIKLLLHHIYKSFTISEYNSAISNETNSEVIDRHQWNSPVELLLQLPKESQTENLAIKFDSHKLEGLAKRSSLSYSASDLPSLFSKAFVTSDVHAEDPQAGSLNKRKSSSVGFLPMDPGLIPKGLTDLVEKVTSRFSTEVIPEEAAATIISQT